MGIDGVEEYRGIHSRAHSNIAAGGDGTGDDIVAGVQIGNDTDRISALHGNELVGGAVCQDGTNGALTDGDGKHTAHGCRSGTCRAGQDHGDQQVFAQSLNQSRTVGGGQGGTGADLGQHIPHENGNADNRADCYLGTAGTGQGSGQDPGVTLCDDFHILLGLQGHILACQSVSLCLGYQYIGNTCHSGSGSRDACAQQYSDQLFSVVSLDTDAAAGAFQSGVERLRAAVRITADLRDDLAQGYNGGQACAGSHLSGSTGDGGGNQQQPVLAIGVDADVLNSGDLRAVRDDGLGRILHDDHIQHAADGITACTDADAGCCCEVHEVGIGGSVLGIGASCVDDRGADQSLGNIIVGNGRRVQAHTCGSRTDGQGAADETGVGIGFCLDGNVFLGGNGAVVADGGLYLVFKHGHGQGSCDTGSGTARRSDDAACQCFHIVVGGGQEVQQINGIQEVLGADVDGDGVCLGVGILLNVDDTLFLGGCGAAVGAAGVSDQRTQILGKSKVAHVHTELLGFHFQGVTFNGSVVTDGCEDLVLAEDQSDACAHAYGGTATGSQSACADSQLGFVGSGQLDVAGSVDAIAGLAFLIEGSLGIGPGHQDCQGAADGSGASASGDGTCQSLRAQSATVLIVHVLGQVSLDGHIAGDFGLHLSTGIAVMVSIGGDGAGNTGNGLVVVDTDANACCDSGGGLAQSHCHAGTTGPEVTVVSGQNIHAAGGDAAGNVGLSLVVGDVQRDSRCHLDGRVLGLTTADIGLAAIAVGVSLIHSALGLGGVGSRTGLRVLAAQRIGRSRQTIVGAGCVLAICIGIQSTVDLVCGLVARVVLLQIILIPGTLGDLVGSRLTLIGDGLELAQNTAHVCTHCGSEAEAVVLVESMGGDPQKTIDVQSAVHVDKHITVDNVDGNCRADGGLFAGGETAGLGQGAALLDGLQTNAEHVSASFSFGSQLLFFRQRTVGIGLKVLLVEGADIQVIAGGSDLGTGADVASDIVEAQVQRSGRVHSDILGCLSNLRGGSGCAGNRTGQAGVVISGDRVGTGYGNGSSIVGALGADVQSTGGNGTVGADTGFAGHIAIVQREGCAHTNGSTGTVGGGSCVDHLLLAGVQHTELGFDVDDIAFLQGRGQAEGVGITGGVILGGNDLLLTIINIVGQLIQGIPGGIRGGDLDQQLLSGSCGGNWGIAVGDGGHGNASANTSGDAGGNGMLGSGIFEQGHSGDHSIGGKSAGEIAVSGGNQFKSVLRVSIGVNHHVHGSTGIAAGQGYGLDLVARVGGNGNGVVVAALDEGVDLTMVGAGHNQLSGGVRIALGVLGTGSVAGIGVGDGTQVLIRLAIGHGGCTGYGIFLLDGLAANRQVAADHDIVVHRLAAIANDGLGSAVDHCHSNGACHTNIGSACARDGVGNKAMGRSRCGGIGLQIQPRGQGVQRAGRKSLAYHIQRFDGIVLQNSNHIVFEEVLQLRHVDDAVENLIGDVGRHYIQLRPGGKGVGIGVVRGDLLTLLDHLKFRQNQIQNRIDQVLLHGFGQSRAEVCQAGLDFLLDVCGDQSLQTGTTEQCVDSIAHHLANDTVFAKEAFTEFGPVFAEGLFKTHAFGDLIKEFFKGRIQILLNDRIALVVLQCCGFL